MKTGSRFRVPGFGLRVSNFEFQVSDFGFRVSGFGSRVSDLHGEAEPRYVKHTNPPAEGWNGSSGREERDLVKGSGFGVKCAGFRV
jgi:hypothetical protein